MYWKRFKNLSKNEKMDESRFILGIDLGNDSSALASFYVAHNTPEIIDISGGYGKPSIPTVIQYISETKEWVYGEYALLNKGLGKEITLNYMIEKLGKKEYVEIDNKPFSIVNILSLYLKEIIGSTKNINPKSEIAGIIVAVPSYLGDEAREELLWAFKNAGYEREIIDLVHDRECIFASYYFNEKPVSENVLILDFGSRELRGGIYGVTPGEQNKVSIRSLSSLFDGELGVKNIDDKVTQLFTSLYCHEQTIHPDRLSKQAIDQLSSFSYQHKDLLFQKNISAKPVKVYFNFAYPPFQKTITKSMVEGLTEPFKEKFIFFIERLLEKNLYTNKKINPGDINTVLCTGGGFEMLWARSLVSDIFPNSNIKYYKNSKGVTAEGAAITAAARLDAAESVTFYVEDLHQVAMDIGIKIKSGGKDKFMPIIEKNSFWWQKIKPKSFILNESTEKTATIDILKRNSRGDVKLLKRVPLDGLPKRPKAATRLVVDLQFDSYSEITAVITDKGFGEFFPETGYEKKINIGELNI